MDEKTYFLIEYINRRGYRKSHQIVHLPDYWDACTHGLDQMRKKGVSDFQVSELTPDEATPTRYASSLRRYDPAAYATQMPTMPRQRRR